MAIYISKPVSLNLSHIRHASHAEPEVLSVKGSGYGAGNGGLSYTWRTIETQDLALGGTTQLTHCNEFLHKDREGIGFISTGRSSTGIDAWTDVLYLNICHPSKKSVFLISCDFQWCLHLLTNMRFLTSSIP